MATVPTTHGYYASPLEAAHAYRDALAAGTAVDGATLGMNAYGWTWLHDTAPASASTPLPAMRWQEWDRSLHDSYVPYLFGNPFEDYTLADEFLLVWQDGNQFECVSRTVAKERAQEIANERNCPVDICLDDFGYFLTMQPAAA